MSIEPEEGAKRRSGGFVAETTTGSEFGSWRNDPRHDQGNHQITFGATGSGQDGFKSEPAKGAEHSGNVTMRQGALNLECFRQRNQRFAFQDTSKSIELGCRPVGEIGESGFDNLAVQPLGLTEENSEENCDWAQSRRTWEHYITHNLTIQIKYSNIHGYKTRAVTMLYFWRNC